MSAVGRSKNSSTPRGGTIPTSFNLGGYICLKFSILWGLCVVVVIRIVHTAIASLVHWIPFTLGAILVGIFIALFITDTIVTVLTIRKLNEKLTVINDMSARLRKESDAISNGLGRLTLLADEKITEQKQEFNEKARPVLEEKLQAQRAQLSEKYEEYRASLEDRRVKAQKSAEDSVPSGTALPPSSSVIPSAVCCAPSRP